MAVTNGDHITSLPFNVTNCNRPSTLNYQPYKCTDYLSCNYVPDLDHAINHYNNIISDSKYYTDNCFIYYISKNTTPGLSFIHLNSRSLNSYFRQAQAYLMSLNFCFDIIAISETWVNLNSINNSNIQGYDVSHTMRQAMKGGGVARYVKHELDCKFIAHKSFDVVDNYLSV